MLTFMPRRSGFTLIELLIVVVLIGIIAAFVVARFGDVKSRTYTAALLSDLRTYSVAEHLFHEEHSRYSADTLELEPWGLPAFSRGVQLDSAWATQREFFVRLGHAKTRMTCEILGGHGPEYTGRPICRDRDGAVVDPEDTAPETNHKPAAAFSWLPHTPTAEESVEFTSSSNDQDGDPLILSWDFGGLGTASGEQVSFSFPENGSYQVILVASDGALADTLRKTITVLDQDQVE